MGLHQSQTAWDQSSRFAEMNPEANSEDEDPRFGLRAEKKKKERH